MCPFLLSCCSDTKIPWATHREKPRQSLLGNFFFFVLFKIIIILDISIAASVLILYLLLFPLFCIISYKIKLMLC